MKVYFSIEFSYFLSSSYRALRSLLGRISMTMSVILKNFTFVSPFVYISVFFQMSFLEVFRFTENASCLLVCCIYIFNSTTSTSGLTYWRSAPKLQWKLSTY